jgi:hypothetical protein
MNFLEPWIFARLGAGLVATWLFVYAAFVGLRVLRHGADSGRLAAASEGRLLLERQAELAAAAARVAAVIQATALLLSALAADRLSQGLAGAMCGYGVVHANAWGPWAIGASLVTAVAAAVFAGLLRFESALKEPLFRAVALASLPLAVLSGADLFLTGAWLSSLDFSVVASCCSTSLDAGDTASKALSASATGRVPLTVAAFVVVSAAALLARRLAQSAAKATPPRARRRPVLIAAGLGLLALPLGLLAVILEVSPHVYEAPHHLCAYCLLRLDALALGYPLIGALVAGSSFALSAGVAALVGPRSDEAERVRADFSRRALGRSALAFVVFLALAAAPIVRFEVLSGGRSLFP